MLYDPDKEALLNVFQDRVKRFKQYHTDPEQFIKIFTDLGFTYVDDGCDGGCPECERKMQCEVYPELKEEWERAVGL